MMAYNSWRASCHLHRQAICRFGHDSDEAKRAEDVKNYWYHRWHEVGGNVMAPAADSLLAKIAEYERQVTRDKRISR